MQTNARPRYAIIVSPELSETGVDDLLTVKLTGMDGIELVERAEVDKVMKERELSAIFMPEGVGLRLELGKTLLADRLFLLRTEETTKNLELFIIDTRTASILFRGQFDHHGATDETIDALSEIVTYNVNAFRDGIKAVVAVPPFLSKGVDRNAEKHQEQFFDMLSAALMQQPGITVMSFEELEAIRHELDFSSQIPQRVVPLIVQGEFLPKRTGNIGQTSEFSFDLALKISDLNGIRLQIDKESLTMQQVVELLAVETSQRIFSLLDDSQLLPFSLEKQEILFTESAERFHRYGMYQLAKKQREVAILINPHNLYQRLNWIEEFYIRNESDRRIAPERDKVFGHLDFIIRNKLVTKSQGCSLFMKFYCDIPNYFACLFQGFGRKLFCCFLLYA